MTDFDECEGPDDGPIERSYDDGSWVPIDEPLRPGWCLSHRLSGPEYDDEGNVDGVYDYVETARVTPEIRRMLAVPLSQSRRQVTARARRGIKNGGRSRRPLSSRARAPSRSG